jgi:hypothetical protein
MYLLFRYLLLGCNFGFLFHLVDLSSTLILLRPLFVAVTVFPVLHSKMSSTTSFQAQIFGSQWSRENPSRIQREELLVV